MRLPLLASSLLLFSIGAFSQDYMFVASYRPKGDGCFDRKLKQIPLEKASQYDSVRRNFYTDYNASSADMYLLKPDKPSIVYSFKTKIQGFACEYLAHGIAYGATVEEATEKMKETAAKNPQNFLNTPDIELKWQGKTSSKETLKTDYKNGVVVEYTLVKQRSGKTTMLINATNSNKDMDVTIKFKRLSTSTQIGDEKNQTKKISEVSIPAGRRVTGSVPADVYDIDFEFTEREDAPKETKDIIIDYIKKKTKERIGVDKNGKIIRNIGGIKG